MTLNLRPTRNDLRNHLAGEGLEFGPGYQPLQPTEFMTRVDYCDAHDRASFLAYFPETEPHIDRFPDPIAYRFDFNTEPFEAHFGDRTFDFVIFNHVLEHIVDPLRMLVQLDRLLRPGGILFLTLPDPRDFWDKTRPLTPLDELVARHRSGATQLTREQVHAFIWHVDGKNLDMAGEEFERQYALLNKRSIHVNIWLPDGALAVIDYANRELSTRLALVDGRCFANEYTFILRHTPEPAGELLPLATVQQILLSRTALETVESVRSSLPHPPDSRLRRWLRRLLGR